jgi:hypothetical protein
LPVTKARERESPGFFFVLADLKAQGVSERDIQIGETVGAFAFENGGYWFGKPFYAGEGEAGRGDIGFVSKDGHYRMLNIAELRTRSVSAIYVEPKVIWAG